MSKKILVISPSTIVGRGVAAILNTDGVEFIGSVLDFSDADSFSADLLLVDYSERGTARIQSFLSLTEKTSDRKDPASPRLLVIEFSGTITEIHALITAGCFGVVERGAPEKDLMNAAESVLQGKLWLSAANKDALIHEMSGGNNVKKVDQPTQKLPSLSKGELKILTTLIRNPDKSLKVLAKEHLFCSESTLRNTLSNMYAKLDVHSRSGLVYKAIQLGFALKL